MRKLVLVVAAVAALAAAPQAVAATVNVSITAAGFVPPTVTVNPGDTVVWTNTDTRNRQVVSQDAGFASPQLAPGATFAHAFPRSGRFSYEDPNVRPRQRGTVVVRAVSASVTLTASRTILIFGGAVTLSGRVSSARPNESVTVTIRPYEQPALTVTVRTGDNGVWTYQHQPRIRTVYQARWDTVTSANATVNVRPRISLRKVAAGRFAVSVVAARSFGGRYVDFRRWNATRRTWVLVKRVYLRRSTATTSVATFRARVPRRAKLRVFMPLTQTQPAYAAGHSNFIVN